MRRDDHAATLTSAQQSAASRGLKAMIPDDRGRPFLDHILSSLADAGIRSVGLVVPRDHQEMRAWYETHPPTRVELAWLVQPEPVGTANALLAAEDWVGDRSFLVLNADNLYPAKAIEALVTLDEPGLIAFDPAALVEQSNIAAERLSAFAILDVTAEGFLARIVEKPGPEERAAAGTTAPISMNIWRLDASIFGACRDVPRSSRGEYELPQAIELAVRRGARLRAVPLAAGVMDLSNRGDVATVAGQLAALEATP